MRILLLTAGLLAVVFATTPAVQTRAQLDYKDGVPMFINYQGYLTDNYGTPINGTLTMRFGLYGQESGGAELWYQIQSVLVRQGVFNVKLQLNESDTIHFRTGDRRWLQLTVNGQILLPRTEITSMVYGIHSAKADNADMLDGKHHTDFIWNSTSQQPGANFWISGFGVANRQLVAYGSGLSGSNPAIYGTRTGDSSFGVYGRNNANQGTGVAGCGNNDTLFYLQGGSGGAFSARRFGLFAYAHDTNGTAIATMGNRIRDTVYTLAQGAGGAFNGTTIGVYGLARNLSGNRAGGFFRTFGTSDTTFAYVAYRYGNTNYKILGDGQVSTVMATREGKRILFAPESPQPYFEDLGTGQLVNGHCRINLDPLFLDCIAVDQNHPLLVFITLTDNCQGVYVKTDAAGFDVYELNNGKSNASFNWRAVGQRKDGVDLRFPIAPEPPEHRAVPLQTVSPTPTGPER